MHPVLCRLLSAVLADPLHFTTDSRSGKNSVFALKHLPFLFLNQQRNTGCVTREIMMQAKTKHISFQAVTVFLFLVRIRPVKGVVK